MVVETILKLGTELGSVTLSGVRTSSEWQYWLEIVDQSAEILDEQDLQGPPFFGQQKSRRITSRVNSWQDAMVLLNQYPWYRLHPLLVHPEFAARVWAAVQDKFQAEKSKESVVAERTLRCWHDCCGIHV